jgi:hypothetical protein
MKTFAIVVALSLASLFATACSSGNDTTANKPANNVSSASPAAPAKAGSDDIPASIRAAFPDAQSITKQHKDLTPAQIAEIEKEAGSKLDDTDHHSYLAFSTTGGARKQIGAATVVEANGKQMVVVYESRNGLPFIKEVRANGVAQAFLDQFKGKGHDDKFQIGQDLKAQGVDAATAKEAAEAIHRDIMTMETLYGSEHTH